MEYNKTYKFYVIEQNDFISVHSIIDSRHAIFDEKRFSSITRPNLHPRTITKEVDFSIQPSPHNDHMTFKERRKRSKILLIYVGVRDKEKKNLLDLILRCI